MKIHDLMPIENFNKKIVGDLAPYMRECAWVNFDKDTDMILISDLIKLFNTDKIPMDLSIAKEGTKDVLERIVEQAKVTLDITQHVTAMHDQIKLLTRKYLSTTLRQYYNAILNLSKSLNIDDYVDILTLLIDSLMIIESEEWLIRRDLQEK